MRRTPRGKELSWHIDLPSDLAVGIDAQDLAEMLGNLVENAAQWAKTSVRLCGWQESDATGLLVEDDGPGFPITRSRPRWPEAVGLMRRSRAPVWALLSLATSSRPMEGHWS
jgi:hypothetical protein